MIGSGVTGLEFVHMFSSLGSKLTLIVSRQQVLQREDIEVAVALEDDFIRRGVQLFKGARAVGIDCDGDEIVVQCDDGRPARGSHALLAIGSVLNSDGLDLVSARVILDEAGCIWTGCCGGRAAAAGTNAAPTDIGPLAGGRRSRRPRLSV